MNKLIAQTRDHKFLEEKSLALSEGERIILEKADFLLRQKKKLVEESEKMSKAIWLEIEDYLVDLNIVTKEELEKYCLKMDKQNGLLFLEDKKESPLFDLLRGLMND